MADHPHHGMHHGDETDSENHEAAAAAAAAHAAQAQAQEVASVVNGAAAAIQAAAAVAAASAWANATAAAAHNPHNLPSDDSMELDGKGGSKMRRAAWTTEEENRLTELANRYASAGQRMCWRLIAQELGTGRTSKQCREHYLNSLRPNMKKGQWTQREEYIIAREHAKIGSHWCIIAKKLPGRTDNSIKNFYNATVRSKAVNKHESFLWLYVDKVHRGNMDRVDALQLATEIWSSSVSPALVNEVLNVEDGAEALMLLSGKRKGEDNESLESLLSRGRGQNSLALLQPEKLQQLMAGFKRERGDAPLTPQELATLFGGGMVGDDGKRQKLDGGMISPGAAAAAVVAAAVPGGGQDRHRQELLQQLGIVGGNNLPLQQLQQPVGQASGQIDLQLLQQQLLLQQLLNAATNNAGQGTSSGATPNGGASSSNYSPAPQNLVSLLQQITAQSVLLSATQQQQPSNAGLQQLMGLGPAGTPTGASAGANSLLSLLGVQDSGGMLGQGLPPDAAAAAVAAAAAAASGAGMAHMQMHDIKQEGEPGSDHHTLEAAAAAAASAAVQAHTQEQQALHAAAAAQAYAQAQEQQANYAAVAQTHAHAQEQQAMHAHAAAQVHAAALQQALGEQLQGMGGHMVHVSADALLAALPSGDMGHQ